MATDPEDPKTAKAGHKAKKAMATPTPTQNLQSTTKTLQTVLTAFETEVNGRCDPKKTQPLFEAMQSALFDVSMALNHKTGFTLVGGLKIHPDWLKMLGEPMPPKG